MNIEIYLNATKRIDLTGIDYARAKELSLTPDEIHCLTYMTDVESHTIVYLRGLLNTCAIDDPEIAAFLPCWAYEEFFHGRALRQFLEACGVPLPETRREEVRKSASFKETIEGAATSMCRLTPHLSAAYLTRGAIQELSTLEGYGLLAARTRNTVLAEMLRRIIKDERRHFAFYYNKSRTYLQANAAQKWTSSLLRRFWTPVGQGLKSQAEADWMIQFLFSNSSGSKAAERIDSTIARLPGLSWFNLLSRTAMNAG
jgi:rubrerythrin